MENKTRIETLIFRDEEFVVEAHYLVDEHGREYTTTELDDITLGQVYEQYKAKHGANSLDDIL